MNKNIALIKKKTWIKMPQNIPDLRQTEWAEDVEIPFENANKNFYINYFI